MIVSIHQPQYVPWLPYFSKIARADTFVFLDKVQFQKNGLHNRNELKNSNGRFWLTIPASAHLSDKLNEVKTSNIGWSKKHIKSIKLNYGKSINYGFTKIGKCRICLASGYTEVHHIISQSMCDKMERPDLKTNQGNLVELCKSCHDLTNHSYYREDRLSEKERRRLEELQMELFPYKYLLL